MSKRRKKGENNKRILEEATKTEKGTKNKKRGEKEEITYLLKSSKTTDEWKCETYFFIF